MQAGHIWESVLPDAVYSQVEQNDASLLKASQRGDQHTFALLVRRYQRRIFNLSLDLLQDEDDASENTQEAFVAAWQELSGFRGNASGFPTWLYRIAFRCCLRQLERRTRKQTQHSARQVEQVVLERRNEKQVAATVERHDPQALVREQMENFPLEYRSVLILRHSHDKTYEEIAEILGMSKDTVKAHLFRARTLLKECLLAQSLVTRETAIETPLAENENSMHTSGQFYLHGGGQDNSTANQETEDFSQQQPAWMEQQQVWLVQQQKALIQHDAWLKQRRGWLDQQQRQFTQLAGEVTQADEEEEQRLG